MTSIQRIKGANGVIIDSNAYLELPKAPTKTTTDAVRSGMIRYNKSWKAFEGVIDFDDGSVAYRRLAQLDSNGRLLTSQLPDSITSNLKYVGTYDPVVDDVDPPFTASVLPAPSAALAGEYYLIRGIQDDAAVHLAANPTSNPFVIFTPPNAAGTWTQIKYYIGKDPSTGSNTVVTNAFARFDVSKIPSTGHTGLLALANSSTELTAAFTNTNNPSLDTGIADSDWIIITATAIQRLRQNRVSILASSVIYDTTVIQSLKRQFVTNNSTVQGTLDNLSIYGLRRTGDSMTNDGTAGAGRLALTYGTATAPSMTFNDGGSDPDLNSGMIPSQWTDNTTGLFHPTTGNIGFTTSGVEKVRITPIGLLVIEAANIDPATKAAIQFQGTGNTVANPGISAINDVMSFTVKGKIQVDLNDNYSTFHGSVFVDQNLTVTGTGHIVGNFNADSNVVLGTTSSNKLLVNSSSTFQGNTSFTGDLNRFKNINLADAGVLTFENAANPTTVSAKNGLTLAQTGSVGNYNFILYNGAAPQTVAKMSRFGFGLPVLNPIDNAVGENGMIAYSTQKNTVMQKANGKWTTVSGGGVEQAFTISSWVLSGSSYTITVTDTNIQNVEVQEAIGATFAKVEVDSIVMSATNAVVSIPSSPDWRFAGRLIITYS